MITRERANSILRTLFPNSSSESTYIGLSTTEPNENGGNVTEPASDTGYKRMKLTVMGTPRDGQIQNDDIIFFPESLGSGWGTITHFCLYNSQTGGVPYYVGELNSPVQVPAGYIPIFRAKALIVGLDKETLDIPT